MTGRGDIVFGTSRYWEKDARVGVKRFWQWRLIHWAVDANHQLFGCLAICGFASGQISLASTSMAEHGDVRKGSGKIYPYDLRKV